MLIRVAGLSVSKFVDYVLPNSDWLQVVKKLWAYIKEKDLQDPKNRRNIKCDQMLHSIFRVDTINMFQMNKSLTKHIWPLESGEGMCLV